MPALSVAAGPVAHRGGQGAGVRAADHVQGAGDGAAGARAAVRPGGGNPRGFRAPAHRLPVVRVPRAPGPVLFRHVRDAHIPGQVLGAGAQGRQSVGVRHVSGPRLDRHVLGRLPVRQAYRIRNYALTHVIRAFRTGLSLRVANVSPRTRRSRMAGTERLAVCTFYVL